MFELEIEEIDVEALTDDEFSRVYNFQREIHLELFPILPAPSNDLLRNKLRSVDSTNTHHHICAKQNSKVIGMAKLTIPDTENSTTWIAIDVKKEWRRKGIGSMLLKKLIEKLSKSDVENILIYSRVESGHAFCKRFGGIICRKTFFSCLDMKNIDWDRLFELKKNLEGGTPEISINVTRGLKKSDENGCYDLMLDFGREDSEHIEGWDFDEKSFLSTKKNWRNTQLERGAVSMIAFARTVSGRIIGFSEILDDPIENNVIHTMYSGVMKEFRGMGLCKRMKTELLLFLKNNLPQIITIITLNDEYNFAMRRINQQLGFVSSHSRICYKFELGVLEKKLNKK
ncbi:MAG: GNAT family N-acetyltransferase [Caldisericia bacterium]|nr:GNAT family N-acetyltransferase [Caldisericia bacterium]